MTQPKTVPKTKPETPDRARLRLLTAEADAWKRLHEARQAVRYMIAPTRLDVDELITAKAAWVIAFEEAHDGGAIL